MSFSFLKQVPVEELARFITSISTRDFSRGDVLYKEKDHVESIYFIREGEIEISRKVLNSE